MWRTIWCVADEATPSRGCGFDELELDLDFADGERALVGVDLALQRSKVELFLPVRV